jgi:hypothetical protein
MINSFQNLIENYEEEGFRLSIHSFSVAQISCAAEVVYHHMEG